MSWPYRCLMFLKKPEFWQRLMPVVVFTIIVQGLTMERLVERFKFFG